MRDAEGIAQSSSAPTAGSPPISRQVDRRQGVGSRPSRTLRFLPMAVLLTDAAVIATAGHAAAKGRERLDALGTVQEVKAEHIQATLAVAGPLMLVLWVLVIAVLGGYRPEIFGSGTEEFKKVLNAGLVTAGLIGVGSFVAGFRLSRGFFLLLFLIGLPTLLLSRRLIRAGLHTARRHGFLEVRVLVAGTPHNVDDIARVLRRERWLGYKVIGAVTPAANRPERTGAGVQVLGDTDRVTAIAREVRANLIFFAGGGLGSAKDMKAKVWELEGHDINVVVAPSLTDISGDRIRVRPVAGLPLIHINPPTWTDAARWGKRLFDLAGATALLVVFSPVLLLAATRIKLFDLGPVLFRQTRVGRHGDRFECLKFRTMVVDAEERLADLHRENGYDGVGLFKLCDDPRVTLPGRWLRRFSVDELPQLWNVLRGDMSLVGPRPPLPIEVATYDETAARRLHVRPGMTGLWQVSGRSDLAWEDAIRLDLYYVDNWSMLQDLQILFRTLFAVLRPRGAY